MTPALTFEPFAQALRELTEEQDAIGGPRVRPPLSRRRAARAVAPDARARRGAGQDMLHHARFSVRWMLHAALYPQEEEHPYPPAALPPRTFDDGDGPVAPEDWKVPPPTPARPARAAHKGRAGRR